MTSTSKYRSGVLHFFDKQTGETIAPMGAVFFEDDFIGAAEQAFPTAAASGTEWGKKLVKSAGSPSVGSATNYGGGAALLALDATSEKQDAVLYWLDNLEMDCSKIGGFETRVQFPVIPTALTQVVCGMMSAWIDGPDNNTCYIRLGLRANGTLLFETFDGTTTTTQSLGVTVATTTEWHTFRVDWSDPTNLQAWLDGSQISLGTVVPFAATGSLAILQPYASVYKASGTGVASMAIDYIRAWTNRV